MYYAIIEAQANKLRDDIIKGFKGYGVNIGIGQTEYRKERFVFKVRFRLGTKAADIKKHAKNVQLLLELPVFQVHQDGLSVYIIASDKSKVNNGLVRILKHKAFTKVTKDMRIPFVVGLDFMEEPVIVDLAKFPNLIIGGTSNSGKTVSLKRLLATICWSCSPIYTKILILDNGAADLTGFQDCCTVIDDALSGLNALVGVRVEMERRIVLKRENRDAFNKLPYVVVVIDEYPALVSGNSDNLKLLKSTMLNLLQRCRHANMSIVLTAQNPTQANLGNLDLGSVAARIAFRCAKDINSRTIIDENGAEELMEKGELLMLSPEHNGVQHLKGAFISPKKIPLILEKAISKHDTDADYSFVLNETDSQQAETESGSNLFDSSIKINVKTKEEIDDRLFARIILWTLERDNVSNNSMCDEFNVGWNRAKIFIDRLYRAGIIGESYEKRPRDVIVTCIDDLSEDVMRFLKSNGCSEEDVTAALDAKAEI